MTWVVLGLLIVTTFLTHSSQALTIEGAPNGVNLKLDKSDFPDHGVWGSSDGKQWSLVTPASDITEGENVLFQSTVGHPKRIYTMVKDGFSPNFPNIEEKEECPRLDRTLTGGESGSDVVILQDFLEELGLLELPDDLEGEFEQLTRRALGRYQSLVGITPATGILGSLTRSYINREICPSSLLNVQEARNNPEPGSFRVNSDRESDRSVVLAGVLTNDSQGGAIFLEDFGFEISTTRGSFNDHVATAELQFYKQGRLVESIRSFEVTETSNKLAALIFDCNASPVNEGEEIEFSLMLVFNSTENGARSGATVSARVMTSETKPENPYNITNGRGVIANGFVQGSIHKLLAESVILTSYRSDATNVFVNGPGNDYIKFEGEFGLGAYKDDFYLSQEVGTSIPFEIINAVNGEVVYSSSSSLATSSVTSSIVSTADLEGGYYKIAERRQEDFTVTVTYRPEVSGVYRLRFDSINVSNRAGLPDRQSFFAPVTFWTQNVVLFD